MHLNRINLKASTSQKHSIETVRYHLFVCLAPTDNRRSKQDKWKKHFIQHIEEAVKHMNASLHSAAPKDWKLGKAVYYTLE